jgi:hypothetical protein
LHPSYDEIRKSNEDFQRYATNYTTSINLTSFKILNLS